MAADDEISERGSVSDAGGFRISEGPMARRWGTETGFPDELAELPRIYGPPLLFAIPRDPRTLFTYWNVDWSDIFSKGEPVDRQVYLRVRKSDGTDESEAVVEPMLGSYYAGVAEPRGTYQAELGFYDAAGGWSAVATAEPVTMPPENASENSELDLATIPFHLSFQRLIDLFRASNGNAIGAILARLQRRIVTEEERDLLTPEEWEVFRALDVSVSELDAARQPFQEDDERLRRKTEAVLGFGATSPGRGLGESSWGSSPTS
jgi:hypothetical protein